MFLLYYYNINCYYNIILLFYCIIWYVYFLYMTFSFVFYVYYIFSLPYFSLSCILSSTLDWILATEVSGYLSAVFVHHVFVYLRMCVWDREREREMEMWGWGEGREREVLWVDDCSTPASESINYNKGPIS